MSLKVAVLGSTRGSNLTPLYHLLKQENIPAEIVLVLSDKADAPILERAHDLAIPTQWVSAQGLTREAYAEKLTQILNAQGVELVVLIGFMRILAANFTRMWSGKVINVHPSLLPKHAGLMDLDVHRAAIEAKEVESGCSVHLVTEEIDAGKILVQKSCPIVTAETPESLKVKVQGLESSALMEAIRLFC